MNDCYVLQFIYKIFSAFVHFNNARNEIGLWGTELNLFFDINLNYQFIVEPEAGLKLNYQPLTRTWPELEMLK